VRVLIRTPVKRRDRGDLELDVLVSLEVTDPTALAELAVDLVATRPEEEAGMKWLEGGSRAASSLSWL
jgi:hypothetical protein